LRKKASQYKDMLAPARALAPQARPASDDEGLVFSGDEREGALMLEDVDNSGPDEDIFW